MASETQSKYIADLTVEKTKDFKEVKELLTSSGIVSDSAETVATAGTIAEITNALTDLQASQFIDVLIATKEPARGAVYGKKRVEKMINGLDDIKKSIDSWDFS